MGPCGNADQLSSSLLSAVIAQVLNSAYQLGTTRQVNSEPLISAMPALLVIKGIACTFLRLRKVRKRAGNRPLSLAIRYADSAKEPVKTRVARQRSTSKRPLL